MSLIRTAPSLRRTLLAGSIAFGAAATAVLIGSSVASNGIREALDANNEELRAEQRIADQIVVAAYGQQIAAFRHIQNPSAAALAEFRARGAKAYGEIRKYLFLQMPHSSRLKVEEIKEVHQEFEVAAQRAFDLAGRSGQPDMQRRLAALNRHGARLEQTVADFVRDRERQGMAARAHLEGRLYLLQLAQLGGALLIAVSAIVFASLVRRRVMVPLAALSVAVRRVGEGDNDVRVPPPRDTEFRDLARHVEVMAHRIRTARREAQERNDELQLALADLQRAQQELVQREKLSAMGEMLAGLAHELNNPLAGVLGLAEVLKADVGRSTDPRMHELHRELIAPLVKEAVRARDLVRNLLHFARASNASLEPVPLGDCVDVAVGLCRHRFAQQQCRIRVQVPDAVHVTAQAQKLEHAIINVVTNALHAIQGSDGSCLTIRCDVTPQSVLLHFEDNGPGFTDVERAFDPFYTTKPVGEGTGLGLSLVHRFVTEFGGSVRAENRPEGGARVTFVLNRAASPRLAPHAPEPTAAIEPSATPPRRVLVAEDEPALRQIQKRLLRGLGLDVLLVGTGRDAITALESGVFDLVITDLRMPGDVSGYDLLAWLERERPDLAASALVVTGDIAGAPPLLGGSGGRVITKPFQREEYESRVRAALAQGEPAASLA